MVLSKKNRLFFAFISAVFIHVLLINMEITQKSHRLPDFHIPQSVNLFLSQTAIDQKVNENIPKQGTLPTQKIIKPQNTKQTLIEETVSEIIEKHVVPVKELPVIDEPVVKKQIPVAAESPQVFEKETTSIQSETGISDNLQKTSLPMKQAEKTAPVIREARPRYKVNPPPHYPPLARKRGYEGTVILKVLVNSEGRVVELQVDSSSNYAMLDRSAINTVKKWFFEPGSKGQKKITMWVKVPVTFRLRD
jgi:TonB family protein